MINTSCHALSGVGPPNSGATASLAPSLRQLMVDETGAEVSELAVVLALVVSGGIGAMALIGGHIQAFYSDLKDAFP